MGRQRVRLGGAAVGRVEEVDVALGCRRVGAQRREPQRERDDRSSGITFGGPALDGIEKPAHRRYRCLYDRILGAQIP